MSDLNLRLLSNSTLPGQPYFAWPKPYLGEFFEPIDEILFVPFAGVTITYDEYTEMLQKAIQEFDVKVIGIHTCENPVEAVQNAKAIAVGGGNTFHLFHELHRLNLMSEIQAACHRGVPYIGWSAGSNTACPFLHTTNDMPIIQPESFEGLNLLPFQINVHYTDKTLEGHGGESRDTRLAEYRVLHPNLPLIGLPEGDLIEVKGNLYNLVGAFPMKVWLPGQKEAMEVAPGIFDPSNW
ncbi:dipeptidase PepE [bacterium SCSIO 12741]|nr:dipeptidase PepE [bacterium SCSIO 12741]